jgi:NADH:ubiquinone oxidoreductase subunit F (NADH-binding)
MPIAVRVLDATPVATLADYLASGGGAALTNARALGPAAVIANVRDAGVRGRGGAGFPTGIKWQTVAANASPTEPSSVVVNAAEGEPGSFKDREILLRNPYRVLEGALIGAYAVGADKVIVGMKRNATRAITRVRAAIAEVEASPWADGVEILLVEGPPEYLLGEETGLIEVIDGRSPFPRIDPPYRRGVDEIVEHADDVDTKSSSSAHVELAGPGGHNEAPPTLVDNVETLAHVTLILQHGVEWFRSIGTAESPGTFVCTVSGATERAGVGELEMGTTLREAIELVGGGARAGHTITAVLQGVSARVIDGDQLDTPCTWEDMQAINSGLGAAAFIVFDETSDAVTIAAAVSRFLGVESCGQCTPCKQDGIAISDALTRLCAGIPEPRDLDTIRRRLETVADSARCSLATQHQDVVGSIFDAHTEAFEKRGRKECRPEDMAVVLPLLDLQNGATLVDDEQRRKQPDWTFSEHWSGQSPADRLDDHRAHEQL